MDSLPNEDETTLSLLPVKEIDHSFSPILGLALIALVLTLPQTVDEITVYLGASASLTIFSLFEAGAAWATTFFF